MEKEDKILDEELEKDSDTTEVEDNELEETAESEVDTEEDAATDNEDGEESQEKKGLFGKKKDKKDKKTQQIEELTDRLKRTMAEFDNFRKRTEREKAGMYENGARGVIEKLLPVVDNFERAFKDVTEEQKAEDPFVDGMDKVFKQVMTLFDELGVKEIEAEGQQFNPDFHNAVMHIEDENLDENIVTEEFQKGYMYKDTVIRHSMVKVAN